MVSATIPEQGGPLSSQDPIAILSNGGDLVDATRKAVTMYGVFGCGSEDKGSSWELGVIGYAWGKFIRRSLLAYVQLLSIGIGHE